MNKNILIGRVTRDLELKSLPGQDGFVVNFGLAVNRRFKKDEVDFFNIVAYGKAAEILSQYLTKGSVVGIVGWTRNRSYDHKDGHKVHVSEVIVEEFEFLGGKRAEATVIPDMEPMDPSDAGDIPF